MVYSVVVALLFWYGNVLAAVLALSSGSFQGGFEMSGQSCSGAQVLYFMQAPSLMDYFSRFDFGSSFKVPGLDPAQGLV